MRRVIFFATLIMAALSAAAQTASTALTEAFRSETDQRQSVGLVLSGGGAKGIAHIGVIQALEDNDIPIDYITGTSMGAIVGGLYAAGYTPKEMMDLILSRSFSYWSTGQIDENLVYYFDKRESTPTFVNINVPLRRDSTDSGGFSIIPSSLISPLPMNFAFMRLFSAYTGQCEGDFDRLFVPFRCVASDVKAKHKVVFSHGSLGDAVRASMSFPAVFEPIEIDGTLMYDGGIYDNFPVDVMREDFAPSIMIGIDVHTDSPSESNDITNQLENMIIQKNDYTLPADEGIKIHIDLNEYSLLDFGKAPAIYQIGYDRAMEMIDSIKGRVHSRIPAETRQLRRDVFKSHTPYLRFDSVDVTGGTPKQDRFLEHIFMPHDVDTIGVEQACYAYYRAITPGKLRNLIPNAVYNPQTGLFALKLKASMKDRLGIGAGGYLCSSPNSMIYVQANYGAFGANSFGAVLGGWVGQSYLAAQLKGRIHLATRVPSAIDMLAVVSRQRYYESDKLFYEDNSPAFITHLEAFGRVGYAMAVGRSGKATLAVGGGKVADDFYNNDDTFAAADREETSLRLAQAVATLEFSTLDNRNFPSLGKMLRLRGMGVYGDAFHRLSAADAGHRTHDVKWLQAEVEGSAYWSAGKHWSFGLELNALWSNRPKFDTYNSMIVNTPAFSPLPSMHGVFNKDFRADKYAAVGVVPIWKPFTNAQVRGTFYCFVPFRRVLPEIASAASRAAAVASRRELAEVDPVRPAYSKWMPGAEYVAELDLVYNFPFASLCIYGNYLSAPSHNWNFGLSFGVYIPAAPFLR